ncbi:Uma2 family endonuclease [Limnothrix redekei]|uniref:Uma2 family endonuclease n=1 Tax=Limnothrix redekei LRLZ20PSL1 TaxID=3112953 RepID=A0ABW7CBJ1_9CYAN
MIVPSAPIEPVAPPQPIDYPDSDGQPMADNTKQFQWIQILQSNLAAIFAHDPQVFVAGNLLWYPVEGNNTLRQAPDVMVVFGVPKGDRGSYQQWRENNIAPQVVFEILSPGNRFGEMVKKQPFYDTYGVEEYYAYDPDRNDLSIWLRSGQGSLQPVFETTPNWISPRVGVRFQLTEETLMLFRPDGLPFSTLLAELQRAEQAEQRAMEAEKRAEQAEQQLDRLAARLRALGIDPDAIDS